MSVSGRLPTILMVIASWDQARAWLRSGVLDYLLADGCRVVLLAPNWDEPYFQKEFSRENTALRPLVVPNARVDYYLQKLRRYLFETMLPVDTNAIRREVMRRRDPWRYWITERLNGHLGKGILKVWHWLDRRLVDGRAGATALAEFQPDLVVVGTLGRAPADVVLLRQARRHGIRTLAVLRGWDNLTAKEYVREPVDKLIVWNEANKREAITLHGIPPGDIYVGGAPHFDVYHRAPYRSREERFREHGLDLDRRLLVLSGQDGLVCPHLEDIVRTVAAAIEADRFFQPCQLLVRPHPNVYAGLARQPGTEEDLLRYEAMSEHVHGDRPRFASQRLKGDISREEMEHLADTLRYADVLLDFFGTLTLEACTVDTPVVYIGFDGAEQRDYYESVRRFGGYTHNRRVLESGGVRLALSIDQLIDHVNAYLRDPSLDAEPRREVVRQNCHCLDGQSALHVGRRIAAYARGEWPAETE